MHIERLDSATVFIVHVGLSRLQAPGGRQARGQRGGSRRGERGTEAKKGRGGEDMRYRGYRKNRSTGEQNAPPRLPFSGRWCTSSSTIGGKLKVGVCLDFGHAHLDANSSRRSKPVGAPDRRRGARQSRADRRAPRSLEARSTGRTPALTALCRTSSATKGR